MRQIIAIGGEPGTGKTTLMRNFIATIDDWQMVEPVKLLPCMYTQAKDCYIFGKYEEGEVFAGTDRLSMAVQPNAIEFVKSTQSNIIFEGDRLFNQSFLEFLTTQPGELTVLYLKTSDRILKERYEERGSNQSEQFLRGRKTKYSNLLTSFDLMPYTVEMENETPAQAEEILKFLMKRF
jgi:broad-specificity NMP kinase